MSLTVKLIRKKLERIDNKRDKNLVTPMAIERFDDILYGENPRWQLLDLYRPKNNRKNLLPVIVSVHGGGWVYGDKERYQHYCMNLAERGFIVVNFTYRLAPEFKFPAAIEDTALAFSWVLNKAEKYKMDIDNVFAVGDSAGAQILALYITISTNQAYASNYNFNSKASFLPKGIALNCGLYQMDLDGRDRLMKIVKKNLLAEGGTKEELDMLNVFEHVTESFPPIFLMTSVKDILKHQTSVMASKLAEVNVPHVYKCYSDSEESLAHVFHLDIENKHAQLCNDDQCDFFKELID